MPFFWVVRLPEGRHMPRTELRSVVPSIAGACRERVAFFGTPNFRCSSDANGMWHFAANSTGVVLRIRRTSHPRVSPVPILMSGSSGIDTGCRKQPVLRFVPVAAETEFS
jgi:hypothetical protein